MGCSTVSPRHHGQTRDRAFIHYTPPPKDYHGLRLAVKDLIDVKGYTTTAGSEYYAKTRPKAEQDAPCLDIARKRGVFIVGKTNLTEFAVSVSGMNDYYGTPRNRLDGEHRYLPGGSSSGSAVAVKDGWADVAFGTDTAGSIRVPAACCGIYGLKTTFGLISVKGLVPISPKHLDTVGPMAKDVPHLVDGMDLLEDGFRAKYERVEAEKPTGRQIRVARFYVKGTDADVDKALDKALADADFQVVRLDDSFQKAWDQAQDDAVTVALGDTWKHDHDLEGKDGVSSKTWATILTGKLQYPDKYHEALSRQAAWQATLRRVLRHVDFIALPTMQSTPPRIPFIGSSALFELLMLHQQNTQAVNFAGNPAVAIPVPMADPKQPVKVTSLQLIGKPRSEAELLNAARIMESKEGRPGRASS